MDLKNDLRFETLPKALTKKVGPSWEVLLPGDPLPLMWKASGMLATSLCVPAERLALGNLSGATLVLALAYPSPHFCLLPFFELIYS